MQVQVHTHVDVGFVDLGVLAETVAAQQKLLTAELKEGASYTSDQAGSLWEQAGVRLRWVGVEASPSCCAKVLVIVEMIKQGAACENIVQVRACMNACLH